MIKTRLVDKFNKRYIDLTSHLSRFFVWEDTPNILCFNKDPKHGITDINYVTITSENKFGWRSSEPRNSGRKALAVSVDITYNIEKGEDN